MVDLKVDLSKFDNSWYKPGSFIKKAGWLLTSMIFLESPLPFPYFLKSLILRLFGAKVGSSVTIKPRIKIKYPWFLRIGSDVWIGEGAWIDNLAPVEIHNNVCISQGVYLVTGSHDYKKITFDLIVKGIIIEEGVWVGAQALVCPGVRLRSHSVVSAGSKVFKDTEPYTVYRGNPAVPIKKRELNA
jgi:putative colanic acid biosynthesis acetyltransferase WcaF